MMPTKDKTVDSEKDVEDNGISSDNGDDKAKG